MSTKLMILWKTIRTFVGWWRQETIQVGDLSWGSQITSIWRLMTFNPWRIIPIVRSPRFLQKYAYIFCLPPKITLRLLLPDSVPNGRALNFARPLYHCIKDTYHCSKLKVVFPKRIMYGWAPNWWFYERLFVPLHPGGDTILYSWGT